MMAQVTVTVSGPTGSGKSRILAEIEIALRAIGVSISWVNPSDQRDVNSEHWADARAQWPPNFPEVALQEINTPIEQQTAASRSDLIETYEGPLYAIGIEHKENEFGMVYGPTPNLQEMLDVLAPYTLLCHSAYSRASSLAEAKCFILELKLDKEGIARHKKLYKWNNKDFSWNKCIGE